MEEDTLVLDLGEGLLRVVELGHKELHGTFYICPL